MDRVEKVSRVEKVVREDKRNAMVEGNEKETLFSPASHKPLSRVVTQCLKHGILAFLIFGPITGLVLDGYDYQTNILKPLILTLCVVVISFFGQFYGVFDRVGAFRSSVAVAVDKPLSPSELSRKNWMRLVFSAAVFAVLFAIPVFGDNYMIRIAISALVYVLLGLGLNIVVGFAGLLDLGFVAFYAVGAYGYALGHEYLGLGFIGAIPLAAVTAGIFGCVLGFPVLRMHGDYLAIVTLGFGEIIRLVLTNWVDFTGGPNGISAPAVHGLGVEFTKRAKLGGTPFHEIFGLEYSRVMPSIALYSLLVIAVLLTIYAVYKLKSMSMGRAWEALREDEIAARSLGINHVTVKLSAFAMGASIGGVAGVFFAASQRFIDPSSFTFFESALILAMVVLGGLGSIPGVIVASVVLTVLPEVLREFSEYRVLVFGVLMVVMMIVKPRGFIKVKRPYFSPIETAAD